MQQPWQIPAIEAHSSLLIESFFYRTKKNLIDLNLANIDPAQALYESRYVILSHGTEADPIFNYANLAAQKLWSISWDEFLKMPSRLSAETVETNNRNELFSKTNQQGFSSEYSGVRITKYGKRFLIKDATLWKVVSPSGNFHGHAVVFDQWAFI